jgi:hypothetical protein
VHELREILRNKEQQMETIQKEIEALRLSLKILETESMKKDMPFRAVPDMTAAKGNGSRMPEPKQFP